MRRFSRRLVAALLLAGSLLSPVAQGEENATVTLQASPGLFQRACPVPVWQGLPAQWMGTIDRRPRPEVGMETKKEGKDPISVLTQAPLTETFDSALRGLFSRCGMNFEAPAAEWRVSAVIEEFHADVEKGLIFGKGKAKSRVTVFAESARGKLSASGGYELEFKKTRKKSLQRLTEILNELFEKTLEQLPKSAQLRGMQP